MGGLGLALGPSGRTPPCIFIWSLKFFENHGFKRQVEKLAPKIIILKNNLENLWKKFFIYLLIWIPGPLGLWKYFTNHVRNILTKFGPDRAELTPFQAVFSFWHFFGGANFSRSQLFDPESMYMCCRRNVFPKYFWDTYKLGKPRNIKK